MSTCMAFHSFNALCPVLSVISLSSTHHGWWKKHVVVVILSNVSLGTIVPNSRDRQGKLCLPKKQKMALKTTLQ